MDSKNALASYTIWGVLALLLVQVLKYFGIHFEGDTNALANDLASLGAVAVIIWGRFNASQPLHLFAPSAISGDAGAITPADKKQGGHASIWAVAATCIIIGLCLFGITSCAGPQVQTKNEANALGYYSLGQAYDQIDGAYMRQEIDKKKAATLTLQVDLASALNDLAVTPSSVSSVAALQRTAAALKALNALTPAQQLQITQALALAKQAMAGGSLPSSNDVAGWLLLSSEMLRTVTAALPAKGAQ